MREQKNVRDAAKKAKLDRVTGGLAGANFGKDGKGIDNTMIDAILKDEYSFDYSLKKENVSAGPPKDELKFANLVNDIEIPPPKKPENFDRWIQCDIINND